MRVLITGAAGFTGSALCNRLASDNKVIGVYHRKQPVEPANIAWEQADLTDVNAVAAICKKYSPAVVIHCAGIAQQKIGSVDSSAYMHVNSEATENLARAASKSNPAVCFIFLSSVPVDGEGSQINIHRLHRFSQIDIFNVCDTEAYEFNTIIQVFKNSGARPNRPVISMPLSVAWLATRIAGGFLHSKRF